MEGVEWIGSLGLIDADYCLWDGLAMRSCCVVLGTTSSHSWWSMITWEKRMCTCMCNWVTMVYSRKKIMYWGIDNNKKNPKKHHRILDLLCHKWTPVYMFLYWVSINTVATVILILLFFNFYTRVKWITNCHITVTEYFEFDYLHIFTRVIYIFMSLICILSLQLGELLSVFLV